MCAALPARRKRAGPSSTVSTALKRGLVSRYEWSSPTATIAFYANGSLGKGARNNAPAGRPNKSPARGTGLSWSCVPYKGLPISSGGQQAHHSNAALQGWFHRARGSTEGGGWACRPIGPCRRGCSFRDGDQQARPFNGAPGGWFHSARPQKKPRQSAAGRSDECIVGGLAARTIRRTPDPQHLLRRSGAGAGASLGAPSATRLNSSASSRHALASLSIKARCLGSSAFAAEWRHSSA